MAPLTIDWDAFRNVDTW